MRNQKGQEKSPIERPQEKEKKEREVTFSSLLILILKFLML